MLYLSYRRCCLLVATMLTFALVSFFLNVYLVYWWNWPGILSISNFGFEGLIHIAFTIAIFVFGLFRGLTMQSLEACANNFTYASEYIVRMSFWGVFLIGVVDYIIALLRVEGLLFDSSTWFSLPINRGTYIHFPLLIIAAITAHYVRGLSVIWLALFVVLAQFHVVVLRFVFSYEQPFMADLVRFWYAALFLFASAYTLKREGHVRVDVIYANLNVLQKAKVNFWGTLLLGLPFCWTILIFGMGGRGSIIIAPLISFEISQSGYGLYVKYLMAAFLLVFAVSMMLQFISLFLKSAAEIERIQHKSY